MKIYLDFDGTVVEHQYPNIGRCNFGCIEIIKKLQDAGHEIILNSYRADCNNGTLEKALKYLNEDYWMFSKDKDIKLLPITEYTENKIHPHPLNWNDVKQNNILFIDDQATNFPLKKSIMINAMMVDWDELDKQLIENDIY
jgi:hypothetical protein